MSSLTFLRNCLQPRLPANAAGWLQGRLDELSAGASTDQFCAAFSVASRYSPRVGLNPTDAERAEAAEIDPHFNPERWTTLDAVRAVLVLSLPGLDGEAGEQAITEAFRFADEGELRGLYRALPHVPAPERFAWQAGEGCRTNMKSVFEAIVCDSAYPARHFDELVFNQAAIKCLFVESPLWRMAGLDDRLSPELARMALDLADERRSAHRVVQHELWLCLGTHGGDRGLGALEHELRPDNPHQLGRIGACYGLARAGQSDRLQQLLSHESDTVVAEAGRAALDGPTDQGVFRRFDPQLTGTN